MKFVGFLGGNAFYSSPSLRQIAAATGPLGLGQSALLAYLPVLVEVTPVGYGAWASVFAIGMVAYLLGTFIWPWLIGRWGAKSTLALGLLGSGASFLMIGLLLLASHWLTYEVLVAALVCSRLLYGLTASAILPAAQTWSLLESNIAHLTTFSGISLQLALGRALGPLVVVGALLLHPLAPVLSLAFWTLLVGARVLLWSAPPQSPVQALRWRQLLPSSARVRKLIGLAVFTTAFANCLQFQASPALENLLARSGESVSQTLSLLLVTVAVATLIAHRLQLRYPPASIAQRLLAIGALLLGCSLGLLWLQSLWQFVLIIVSASMALAWLTPLYSAELAANNAAPTQVAAQLGVSHITGHILGLMMTAFLLGFGLEVVYLGLAAIALGILGFGAGVKKVI